MTTILFGMPVKPLVSKLSVRWRTYQPLLHPIEKRFLYSHPTDLYFTLELHPNLIHDRDFTPLQFLNSLISESNITINSELRKFLVLYLRMVFNYTFSSCRVSLLNLAVLIITTYFLTLQRVATLKHQTRHR